MTDSFPVPPDPHGFAAQWLPTFEQSGGPSDDELQAFIADCYEHDFVVVYDWPEWRDQAEVLLETSGAMERTNVADLQRLLTLLIRQDGFIEGAHRYAVEQGWFHAVLGRMRAI